MNNTIPKGTPIVVRAKGITVRGIVYSARNWGGKNGWYIEISDANVPGGFSYWKQGYDGGQIVEIDGEPYDPEEWSD